MSGSVLIRSKLPNAYTRSTLQPSRCQSKRKLAHIGARHYVGQAAVPSEDSAKDTSQPQAANYQSARQKQADKEFFADLLSSAATKRDVKAYISRLKSAVSPGSTHGVEKVQSRAPSSSSTSKINPNAVFGRSRAVDASPVFYQGQHVQKSAVQEPETLHLALVKLSQIDQTSDEALHGIAQTLAQLSRLSMAPIIVIETSKVANLNESKRLASEQVDRLISAIDHEGRARARRVDNILSYSADERVSLALPDLLFRPLRHGRIPIVLPIAYSEASQQATPVSADAAILALTRGLTVLPSSEKHTRHEEPLGLSLDRIIVIDPSGPIPSSKDGESTHVFINMDQEYHLLQEELRSSTNARVSPQHASNLSMLKKALQLLPSTASGLLTTPEEAGNPTPVKETEDISSVGTRRQKNPLIHNLLTDKPAYSSSLPSGRLGTSPQVNSGSTFVKKGMPLTILPNPAAQEWSAGKQPWIKLTDPRIDLDRLVYLINDSFDRKLDVDAYLRRVNDRMAGVIIAGEYEGGAILTWESPPGADAQDTHRLVPYLDKFAVLKRSQGAGGVADTLFNAMVRTCFPNGVCWRSRKSNPVNKWYFERSRGTWKIPDANWTMFWTTPGVAEDKQIFLDYEAVCRGVQPTWADDKKIDD